MLSFRKSRQRERRVRASELAFTVTELLVVLALLAILSILLFGGVHRISSIAKRSKCITNLKAYGAALTQHAVDHHSMYLAPGYVKGDNQGMWNYRLHHGGYLSFEAQRKLYCPTLTSSDFMVAGLTEAIRVSHGYMNSVGYAYNMWLGGKRMGVIQQPGRTVLLIETYMGNPVHGRHGILLPADQYAYRHDSTLQILYCDGHVASWSRGTPLPPREDVFWAYPPLP